MDAATPLRKRSGRPPKAPPHQTTTDAVSTSSTEINIQQTLAGSEVTNLTMQSLDDSTQQEITELHASVLALSSEPEDPLNSSNILLTGSGGECRRSSRKKVIKFDVRDLLNKNRKPHKIQIEARIDSNAPTGTQPKPIIEIAGTSSPAANAVVSDLTSKQKTFIEKSAIFRRFSISAEQQNKVVPPLRPPPLPTQTQKISLLGKSTTACEIDAVLPAMDAAKIAQARRLSRTQEIFNASMMKSKQNSSLIVAQMQSNSSSSCSSSSIGATVANLQQPVQKKVISGVGKRKGMTKINANIPPKATVNPTTSEEGVAAFEVSIQKRRGRPPKSKVVGTSLVMSTSLSSETEMSAKRKVVPVKENIPKDERTQKKNLETNVDNANVSSIQMTETSQHLKLNPEKAKNWKEYKACLTNSDDTNEQNQSISTTDTNTTNSLMSVNTAENQIKMQSTTQLEDVILEISSSSSSVCSSTDIKSLASNASSHKKLEKLKISSVDANETKQRNFAVVSFLKESLVFNDNNITGPEFIVAAVEEIIPVMPDGKHNANTSAELVKTRKESERMHLDFIDIKKKSTEIKSDEMILKSPLTRNKSSQEILELNSSTRRTLSSSESETNSDRSNKPYKQGDKLRVSLKRVTMPESPSAAISSATSSSYSSSSEISNVSTSDKSHLEKPVSKGPTAKRSRRLQKKKKFDEKNDADSTTSEEIKDLQIVEKSKTIEEHNKVEIFSAEETNELLNLVEKSLVGKVEVEKMVETDITKSNEAEQQLKEVEDNQRLKEIEVTTLKLVPTSVENTEETLNRDFNQFIREKEIIENVVEPKIVKTSEDHSTVNQLQEQLSVILSNTQAGETRKSIRLAKPTEIVDESKNNQYEVKEDIIKNEVLVETAFNTTVEVTPTTVLELQDTSQIDETLSTTKANLGLADAKEFLEITATRDPKELTKNIQNVSVETSTLLDILRTVQSNKVAETIVSVESKSVEVCKDISLSDIHKSSLSPVSSEKALTLSNKLQDSRATNSPSRSETNSPQTTKKSTRRYERRSRRGDETLHKTLEETFAEIAAQSSKAILELAAREEEEISAALEVPPVMNYSEDVQLDKCDDDQTEERTDEHKALPKDIFDDYEKLKTKIVLETGVDTSNKQLVEVLSEKVKKRTEGSDDAIIEPIKMEVCQSVVKTSKTDEHIIINDEDVLKNKAHLETEPKSEFNKLPEPKNTESHSITTPTRRGRKPKIKTLAAKDPETFNELSENIHLSTVHRTESLDKSKTTTENPKKSNNTDEFNLKSIARFDDSESSHEKTYIPINYTAENKSMVDNLTPDKEDNTIKPPSKSCLLKISTDQLEVTDNFNNKLITDDTVDAVSIESTFESSISTQNSLKQNIICDKDGFGLSNKKKDKKVVDIEEHVKHIEKCDKGRSSFETTNIIQTIKRGKSKPKLQEVRSDKIKTDIKNIEEGEESSSSLESSTSIPNHKRGKNRPKSEHFATEQPTTSGKKKTSKFADELKTKVEKSSPKTNEKKDKEKGLNKKSDKKKFLEVEETAAAVELSITFEEKSAKKKRQKKLKEAFEAALSDNLEKPSDFLETNDCVNKEIIDQRTNTPDQNSEVYTLPMTPIDFKLKSETSEESSFVKSMAVITEPEEDPDPLKDIEKFIEDGVNLLKRDYKIDDDSVDKVILKPKLLITEDSCEDLIKSAPEAITKTSNITTTSTEVISIETSFTTISPSDNSTTPVEQLFFETPANTPLVTPGTTPPPKSPISEATPDEISGVRRSHRIKQITKTPKALVGRGLVRDKERFSYKDDVETKSNYSLDEHLMDLAEVEAKNAKFLKEMEERLSNFQVIKENEYMCERVISREARKMICDCFLTSEEEERGELGCGEDCLNRLLMIECGPDCNVKDRCTNKRFQKFLCSPCCVFRTEKKGFGIMAEMKIPPGEFLMEYVGEVINGDEFENRRSIYSQDKNRHYYFMALRSDAIIDATIKGNISRFINHSCDPNAETQKWTVNGELRIGFFSRKSIKRGEEITFDYQYQRYGREAQRCYCESSNCRGWIGEEPNSDEGEQLESDEEEEETEMLAESLLDDDDDSDTESVTDAEEEVQKKLEIAAAEAKLTPINDEHKEKISADTAAARDKKKKTSVDVTEERKETEEDSKSKFKKLLSKMAEKVAKKKQKQNEKKQRKRRPQSPNQESAMAKARYLEDPDIEDEVNFLSSCGLKNQSDTLRLSRLMVRAKLVQTRLNLLQILRKGELPCRRLFLDYHGMRFLHGWMSEDGGDMNIRMALLETLESLPIANKTVLTDSKVYQAVRNWCGTTTVVAGTTSSSSSLSPSDESSKESSTSSSNSQQVTVVAVPADNEASDLQKLAVKLTASWDSLPEIFRIPKRERIEQMKEHEREADRQYAAAVEDDTNKSTIGNTSDRYQRDRFGRGLNMNRFAKPHGSSKEVRNITVMGAGLACGDPRRRLGADSGSEQTVVGDSKLSKEQRREMFAAKVARDEAEKRLAEERREFETKCRFFGLDPKKTRPPDVPFCVNPATGQWFSTVRKTIQTPPSYAHVQVPVKPKSTDPADYQLPAVVSTLPPQWKYAITPLGKIYYYHVQIRIPQWEPPSPAQMYGSNNQSQETDVADSDSESEGGADDSTDDDDEIIMSMNQTQLKTYIEKKIEVRRQQRYNRLVDERCISPRREEDRMYNQLEVRKYKENKEKIRKRKEEIRRKRADALKNSTLNMCTLGSLDDSTASGDLLTNRTTTSTSAASIEEQTNALPIQDYLLSSDDDCGEDDIKSESNNSPLIDKIVQGDKIVDELDALTTKRTLKRAALPSASLYREVSGGACSSTQASTSAAAGIGVSTLDKHEHKKRKLEKKEKSKKSKDSSDSKYRKTKEKFRCEIAGIIVHHLKPYRKDSCFMGRIQSDNDFNHLARKLTHFVMIKELKYCESVRQTLVVTESVKNKSREFIKKYMAKYGDVYVRSTNDPEFKDIPFTL